MNKIRLTKTDIFTAALCLTAVLPGIVFYSRLPAEMPVHFDINDQPDRLAPKAVVIFLIPVLMCILQLVCCAFAFGREKDAVPGKLKAVCRIIIPVITVVLETLTVMFAMDMYKNIGTVILCLLGLVLIIVGNYMPKTRRNSVFGIKLPSTLRSDRVWDSTHRLAGWLWTLTGIIIIPLAMSELFIVSVILIFIVVAVPVIYSLTISD